ncbi:hypothetical protein D3C81_487730 [compost metagenome]
MPQDNKSASRLADYAVTVDEVKQQSGLDFCAERPDEPEEAMEFRLMAIWAAALPHDNRGLGPVVIC